MLTLNLNILPGYIIEKIDVKWNSELPFSENVGKMIMEFKKARGLEVKKIDFFVVRNFTPKYYMLLFSFQNSPLKFLFTDLQRVAKLF